MKTDGLKYTNERVMELMKNDAALWSKYMDAYGAIASSDSADKETQADDLFSQMEDAIQDAQVYKNITITGTGAPKYTVKL